MQEILSANSSSDLNWNDLRPVLDEAMHELNEKDREAILLRYFEDRSLAEVGANLGLAENSARMRVGRALEKLRGRLARRGITSTAAALSAALASQTALAAPAGLAATVAGASLAGAAVAGGGTALAIPVLKFMNTVKLATAGLAAVVALGIGVYLGTQYQADRSTAAETTAAAALNAAMAAVREENGRLKDELALARSARADLAAQGAARDAEVAGPARGRNTGSNGGRGTSSTAPGQWQLLAELQQKKFADPRIKFVSPNGKIDDAFATLFALSSAERQALQQSLDRAAEQLAGFEHTNATVSRDPKGKVTIVVNPFPAAGGVVYDDLMKAFAQTLGPERTTAFLALGAEQVEGALGQFGAAQRTVTISYDPTREKKPYEVWDVKQAPSWGRSSVQNDFGSLQEAMNAVGSIARLVPQDFTQKK